MQLILNIVKGALIGVANIIPGVSGGTMALSLGLYDRIIEAIAGLLKDFKRSALTLLPILIGCLIGIVGFTYAVDAMIANQPLITSLLFSGFVLGGVPMLFETFKASAKRVSLKHLLLFALFFAVAVFFAAMGEREDNGAPLSTDWLSLLLLFLAGVVASATMVIPGISGSLMLMIMGYYFGVLGAIKQLTGLVSAFDADTLFYVLKVLVPFGIGVVVGIGGIAKLIGWLFKRFPGETYAAILGLLLASPVAIFLKIGAGQPAFWAVLVGIVAFAAGGAASYWLGKKE